MSQINISIDCVLFGYDSDLDLKVLLIQRKYDPNTAAYKDHNSLPGDLIKYDEELSPAASRILESLTGISDIYLKQFSIFSDPNRVKHPKDQKWLRKFRAHPEERVITVGYIALVNIEDFNTDATYFKDEIIGELTREGYYEKIWAKVNDIPELAFDHNKIFASCKAHLVQSVQNKPVGFELLPERFTLSQLQNLYEVILERKFDKRNFRKKINSMKLLIDTGKNQKSVSHRPAKLFQFDKEKYLKLKRSGYNFEI